MNDESTALARVEIAHRALMEATTLPDVKRIRDTAEAIRQLARQARLSLEAQNMAAELRIRAERKSGELLKEMPTAQGRRTDLETSLPDVGKLAEPTRAELGITERQSMNWQRIANIPEDRFEQHIDATKATGEELTTASVLRLAEEVTAEQEQVIDVTGRVAERRASDEAQTVDVLTNAGRMIGLDQWDMKRRKADAILVGMSYGEAVIRAKPAAVVRDIAGASDVALAVAKLREFAQQAAAWGPEVLRELASPDDRGLRLVVGDE